MKSNARTRRRLLGGLCLGVAVIMLILGETIFKDRLTPVGFLLYWLGCLVLTLLAIGVALLDLFRVRVESRDEQRELIESTIREVEREKSARAKNKP